MSQSVIGGHIIDGRRTDSRRRIRATALRMFTERGYEHTTLAEVAAELGMTRAAVLHHYASKEELLTSSYVELRTELNAISRSGDRTVALDHFGALVAGELGAALVCAQVNEHALRGLPRARELQTALDRLARALAPGHDPAGRIRGRLAVAAVVMAEARASQLGGRRTERRAAALAVARDLLDD